MDARTAKRSGADEVYVLYRKGFENMTCTKAELEEAKEDGVKFELFKAPLEITEEGVKYIEIENAEDDNGKIITVNKEGTEGLFECDSVIIAISQAARNNIVSNTTGLEINKWRLLITDKSGHTTCVCIRGCCYRADTVVELVAHATFNWQKK